MTLQKPEETGRDGITRHTARDSWFQAMINSREMINSIQQWVGKAGRPGRVELASDEKVSKSIPPFKTAQLRKIICDCSLAMTSCLVTDSFLLLNTKYEPKRCRRAARPQWTAAVCFSGLPTCWVQAAECKFNGQIETGGILGERQTLERQHPHRCEECDSCVLQQKEINSKSFPEDRPVAFV